MEEKVMSRLKQAVKMLRYNFSSIALFEIVYRVLSLAILTGNLLTAECVH